MESNSIKQQYIDSQGIAKFLTEHDEITYAIFVKDIYRKIFILSAASFFEKSICMLLKSYVSDVTTSKDKRIVNLVENKVIGHQYYALFNWDDNNTNSFWGLFGTETKNKVKILIRSDENLKKAEKDFLEIGRIRNELVHRNFAENNQINLTLEEINIKYISACKFIDFVSTVLNKSFDITQVSE